MAGLQAPVQAGSPLGQRRCVSVLDLGAMFGGGVSKHLLITEHSRWRTRLCGVCFARFKGLLKVQLPLKSLLPLARLPSWPGRRTGLLSTNLVSLAFMCRPKTRKCSALPFALMPTWAVDHSGRRAAWQRQVMVPLVSCSW